MDLPRGFLLVAEVVCWLLHQSLGTVLAVMTSVVALSLPGMLILRKVLKVRLVATFVAVVGSGILVVRFVFNAVI